MTIPFPNDTIHAEHKAEDGTESILASASDLIAILDMGS